MDCFFRRWLRSRVEKSLEAGEHATRRHHPDRGDFNGRQGLAIDPADTEPDQIVVSVRRITDPFDRLIRIEFIVAPTSGIKPAGPVPLQGVRTSRSSAQPKLAIEKVTDF